MGFGTTRGYLSSAQSLIASCGSSSTLALLCLCGCHPLAPEDEESGPPNVVLIMVDDLRTDLGTYGHPLVSSPGIDRLAARGIRFDRAYSQYPLCNPSRTSLLTGLRPDTTGVVNNNVPFLTRIPQATTLPAAFRQNGYFTAGVGKIFHGSGRRGGGRPQKWIDPDAWDLERFPGIGKKKNPEAEKNSSFGQIGRFQVRVSGYGDVDLFDGRVATAAIEVLEQARAQPLFLAVGFSKPHLPFEAPRAYFELYQPEDIDRIDRESLGDLSYERDDSVFSREERLELTRAYWACVSFVDSQVGRILDALDRLSLWDNTVVVLLSDHGFHLGEQGEWLKTTLYEVATRVPLLVYSPGMNGGLRSTEAIVELVDLYPTLLELAGLEVPTDLGGQSFAPLLTDPTAGSKGAAFSQVKLQRVTGRSVRTDRWRYTEWDRGRRGRELYDHDSDPLETHNLADDPDLRRVRKRLRRTLRGSRR